MSGTSHSDAEKYYQIVKFKIEYLNTREGNLSEI